MVFHPNKNKSQSSHLTIIIQYHPQDAYPPPPRTKLHTTRAEGSKNTEDGLIF